ncbi:hypothetical protein K9M48_02885 [Candidatus Gracilibacteria bacterium]|nr:hypothetical protein [Candidatus Gracilibacteria bacterium]
MYIFFEAIKGIFLLLTILIGVLFLRGNILLGEETFVLAKQIAMPGYMVFCGLIIGYLIAHIRIGNELEENSGEKNKIYIKSFIIGIIIGFILAISYVFI